MCLIIDMNLEWQLTDLNFHTYSIYIFMWYVDKSLIYIYFSIYVIYVFQVVV